MPPRAKSKFWWTKGSGERRRRSRGGSDRRRVNRVKFRRRYATARLKSLGELAWITSRLAVVAGVLVWLGGMGWQQWQSSPYFKVQGIRFEGDIPTRYPATLPLKEGMGLFSFDTDKLERDALRRFSELRDLSVSRALDRTVVVRGRFREPVALLVSAAAPTGIDAFGQAFPLPRGQVPPNHLPSIDAPAAERANAVAALSAWERKLPAFFDVVKNLECDRMRAFRVELSDGVIIEWGSLEPATVVEKGRKILRIMKMFSAEKSPAHLKFVAEDRIVMDAAWRISSGKTREGAPIVKT